ncbi:unnamed protein product [Echinostoma caproni]|uniref:SUN domain-containing protein n=1 Tax=Echinostoma caproni TaxID=27848 RepID=A0A183A0X4_9TREM|nr:unnamed protein product [Echinostoma caproni]
MSPITSGTVVPKVSLTNTPSSPLEKELFDLPPKSNKVSISNQTTNSTRPNAATSPSTTTSTTLAPKKPSVIDAGQLNQDASSADGSNTAVKMKQLKEERQIETVAGSQNLPAPSAEKTVPVSIVAITPAPKVKTTANTSSSNTNRTVELKQNGTTGPPFVTLNSTGTTENENHFNISLLRTTQSASVNSTIAPASTTSTVRIYAPSTAKQSVVNRTTPLSHSTTPPPPNATTARSTVTAQIPVVIRTSEHHRIVEHSASPNFARGFLFTQPLQPIQRVYCLLSALGLITWLLSLTLTGWCRGLRCIKQSSSTGEQMRMRARARRALSHSDDTRPLVSNEVDDATEESAYGHWLPAPRNAPGIVTSPSHSRDNSDEDTLYVSAQDFVLGRDQDPTEHQPSGPGKVVRQGGQFDVSRHAPFATQWPQVSWPADAWLLLAEFFSTGLETAFGGFVHSFTVRHLFWSSVSNAGSIPRLTYRGPCGSPLKVPGLRLPISITEQQVLMTLGSAPSSVHHT